MASYVLSDGLSKKPPFSRKRSKFRAFAAPDAQIAQLPEVHLRSSLCNTTITKIQQQCCGINYSIIPVGEPDSFLQYLSIYPSKLFTNSPTQHQQSPQPRKTMHNPTPLLLTLLLTFLTLTTHAQSDPPPPPPPPSPPNHQTWAEKHLEQEHHINNFDPGAFFTLHDFDSSNTWTRDEVIRFYGLSQPDTINTVSEDTKSHVWRTILDSMDDDHNGEISMEEFLKFSSGGNTLPDFGVCIINSFLGRKKGVRG